MTVSEAMIAQVSPFTVGDSGDFDATDYAQYETWAALELDQLDPGLDTATYDRCHAIMICHCYEASRGDKIGLKSEKIGDYSYTRADSGGVATTSYYIRVIQILAQWGTEQATVGVERDDSDDTFPNENFKLDQSEKVIFE